MTYEEIKNLKVNELILKQDDTTLFKEVKSYLSITWNEEDEDIHKLIAEAKQHLSKKIGAEINYSEDLSARRLLKEYCRYVRNYSKEYFEQNFIDDIVFLQLKYASEDLEDGES